MTKTERKMKKIIEENSLEFIDGIWVMNIAEGIITIEKQEKLELVFRETGFKKRGKIFTESEIAPYFDEIYLQMLPARFDMILRVAGSMITRQFEKSGFSGEKMVITIKHGIGVDNALPVTCPYIDYQIEGGDSDPIEDMLYEVTDIMVENFDLLTDSFLGKLKNIVESSPAISEPMLKNISLN